MALSPDAEDRSVLLDQLVDVRPHPAGEAGERARLLGERLEKDRLRHPDGVRILGGNLPEIQASRHATADAKESIGQFQVRLGEDVLEKPQLIEQPRRARLQDLAAELAIEVRMTLEHDDARAAFREEQSKHETGGSATDDTGVGPHALDDPIPVCHAAIPLRRSGTLDPHHGKPMLSCAGF